MNFTYFHILIANILTYLIFGASTEHFYIVNNYQILLYTFYDLFMEKVNRL